MKQFQNNILTKFLNFSESNMIEYALLFLKILIWHCIMATQRSISKLSIFFLI